MKGFLLKVKKSAGRTVFLILVAFIAAMLVTRPDRYAESAFTGLKVWAVSVLPSLLPFFFITALLTTTGALGSLTKVAAPVTRFLYGANGISAFVQAISFLSGYPVGVKVACDLKDNGVIGPLSVTKLSTFCSTSGPTFIVGSVGVAMMNSKIAGITMLCCHIAASVACGVIFRRLPCGRQAAPLKGKTCDNVLYESVYSSVISVAIVGGFIAVFYTFACILSDVGVFSPLTGLLSPVIGKDYAEGVAFSRIECTFACKSFSTFVSPLGVALSCGAISFGGLSVWCQSATYLIKAGADVKTFALSKLTHAVLSFVFCLTVCSITGV
ncbi:MAG: hypothetical protein ILP02_01735 [Clostridia bacterium]|nr:hypothetical protein [Clostridia bacterium]